MLPGYGLSFDLLKPMTHSQLFRGTGVASLLFFAGVASAAAGASPISSESFWTVNAEPENGEYREGNIGATDVSETSYNNTIVVSGNSGFDISRPWAGDSVSLQARLDFSLDHDGLVGGSQPGSLRWAPLEEGVERNSHRSLAEELPLSASYYLSGLVCGVKVADEGAAGAAGLLQAISLNTFDISTGFQIGLFVEGGELKLAAFANNQKFELVNLSREGLTRLYQVVLKLDVDATGDEILTAWIVREGDGILTPALEPTPIGDFWDRPSDLQTFAIQTRGAGVEQQALGHFDEMRFGTTLEAVTTAVP
jgi:hypothetical protein